MLVQVIYIKKSICTVEQGGHFFVVSHCEVEEQKNGAQDDHSCSQDEKRSVVSENLSLFTKNKLLRQLFYSTLHQRTFQCKYFLQQFLDDL